MFKVNDNYLKLPGSYLFSTIGKKVNAYSAAHPDKKIIRLGIGDVTQPLAPAIIDALHGAVDEMGKAETFHGYAPDLGYEFLRNAIAENDYKARGCDIAPDEIFVSDGAKCDCGNIQEIFSLDNKIAVCDPVYPVYVDSNVMAGRTGTYDADTQMWSDVIYMPCLAENGFAPELPKETPDLIYLCFPNNPTGAVMEREDLDIMSEFMVMAATLLDIKCRMLLPKEVNEEGEEEDPRAELVQKLLEYKMYKYMSFELRDRQVDAARNMYREQRLPKEVEAYRQPIDYEELIGDMNLNKLHEIFRSIVKKQEDKIDPVRSQYGNIEKDEVDMDIKMLYVEAYAREHKTFSFRKLLEKQNSKMEVIVTFLIILELMKTGKINISQENIFDDIMITSNV